MVTDKYIWCLDFKGGLYCSALPNDGLRWQKFEDNVQQLAVSPSGKSCEEILLKKKKMCSLFIICIYLFVKQALMKFCREQSMTENIHFRNTVMEGGAENQQGFCLWKGYHQRQEALV